jgi:hypothetical protein
MCLSGCGPTWVVPLISTQLHDHAIWGYEVSTLSGGKKRKPSDPSLRFPSDQTALKSLWLGLKDIPARTNFLEVAIVRGRLDVLVQAASSPQEVGDFVGGLQTDLRRLIAKNDSVEALLAVARLSDTSFRVLVGGCDPLSVQEFGSLAIQHQGIKLWQQLLSMGLNPFASGKFGTTLCHMAASHGWVDGLVVVDHMHPQHLARLADPSQRTLLHTSSRYGQHGVLRWLLTLGADVQARDKNGRSPLFSCVLGHTEGLNGNGISANWQAVAVELMRAGASPMDYSGKTARSSSILDKVKSNSQEQAVELERLHKVFVEAVQLDEATSQASGDSRSRRL